MGRERYSVPGDWKRTGSPQYFFMGTSKNYIFQGLRQIKKRSLLDKMSIFPTEPNEEKSIFRTALISKEPL
jgi:hypothetical protein